MKKLVLSALLLASFGVSAQMTTTTGFTATQLGNNLAGSNVNVTNASISGMPTQFGTFNYVGAGFPLSSGVILSTGNIADAPGPNSNGATTGAMGGPGDPDLTAIAGVQTFDAVSFQFDFEVQSDMIEFSYIFASEEYNEFVGSNFNDVFAFYISGPGITGWENIALVPNTTVPVAINNINNGSFFQYYNDNTAGAFDTEYDGFTDVLVARRENLIPCQVYTLRLVIADAGDQAYDAAVFLQENSLVQGNVSAQTNTVNADGIALEGCIQASFTFQLDSALTTNTTVPYQIGGTATNGVDYQFLDTLLIIPAGDTAATIIIDAYADGINEGQEYIELYFQTSACGPVDTVTLFIDDADPIEFSLSGVDLACNGDGSGEVDVTITGGFPPYTITLTDTVTGAQSTHTSTPISGLDASTYLVEITDSYGCGADAVIIGGDFDAGTTFLPDGTGVSYTSAINITGFNAGQTMTSANQINNICATMEHSYANDLTIVLEAPNGAQVQLKNVGPTGGAINACNLGEPVASGPVDSWNNTNTTPGVGYQYCWSNTPVYATMNAIISATPPGPPPQYTYTTLAGNTYTDYYLPPGSYTPTGNLNGFVGTPLNGTWTLIVTDNYNLDNGYIFDWSISLTSDLPDSTITLNEPPGIDIAGGVTSPACGAADGEIDITPSGDNPPFTFSWSNGATTEDLSGIAAGSYTVTVTDANGCSNDTTYNVGNASPMTISASVSNPLCQGGNNGAIDLTITTGTPPYSVSWSNGATTEDILGLTAGTYTATVTDAVGCVSIETYTVGQPAAIVLSASVLNEECGDGEGEINLTVAGGTGPYTYSWSNGASSQDLTDLSQGNYVVTVTDANGCSANATYNVINLVGSCAPQCDLAITGSTVNNENCGTQDGSVSLNIFTTNGPYTVSWSNGATTNAISGLQAGTYDVTISDQEGCVIQQSFTVSNQTTGIAISASSVSNEVCGNSAGGVDITIAGGNLPYTYAWSNGATSQDITGVAAGSYNVTVTDASGCSVSQSFSVINQTGTLAQTYGNADDEVCGNGQGSIDIIITGGTLPYTYSWSNGATTEDLIGISAGTYSCTITDASGCVLNTPVYTVNNQAGTLVLDLVDVDNEVCGNSNGEIVLTASGGTAPISYNWNTGATTASITGLSAGTYNCTISDASGCSLNTGSLNVLNESGTLNLVSVVSTDEICGNDLGTVNITVTGGTAPLAYSWSNGASTQDLSNLSAGTYTGTVTDANGCEVIAIGIVNNDPGTLQVINVVSGDETCGNGTGSIDLILSGATAPVSYSWNNGATTEDLTGLSAGNYSVAITDAAGCTATAGATIQNNSGSLTVLTSSVTGEICGDGSGAVDITVSGGNSPYTFSWSNGATTEDLSALTAGTYTCTVTDNAGCSVSTGPVVVSNSSAGLSISLLSVNDQNCAITDGAIDVNINGGTAPFSYSWSNGATTQDLVGIAAGSYTLTVTDAGGCVATGTYTVSNNPGSLQVDGASVANETCGNASGSIDLSVSGGTAPISFAWTNGSITEDISGLASGGYQVLVTDANGCQVVSPVYQVNDHPGSFVLTNLSTVDEVCGNGTGAVNTVISGGQVPVTYSWNNGAITQNLSGLNAGVYTCVATDANGCQLNFAATVNNTQGTLQIDVVSVTDETCGNANGAADIDLTGGTAPYSVLWSNGATTEDLLGVQGGSYIVSVTDANGCATNQQVAVGSGGGQPVLNSASITNEICGNNQGTITVNPTGGTVPYSYAWTAASPCCTYQLEMLDANNNGWGGGAAVIVSINGAVYGTFQVPVGPGNAVETQNIPLCNGDQLQLEYVNGAGDANNSYNLYDASGALIFADGPSPTGGVSYTGIAACAFSGTGNSISGLSAGTYHVTVTDANGCTATGSYTVINNAGTLAISNPVLTDEFCGQSNGAIDVTISGGVAPVSIVWNTGATTEDLNNIPAGTYSVTATDDNGCQVDANYTLTNSTGSFQFGAAAATNDFCSGAVGAIDITVNGGVTPYAFSWNNGATTEDLTGLQAGQYIVEVTDAAGCSIVDTISITNTTNGLAVSANLTNEDCGAVDGSIDLTVTGGTAPYAYAWSNGATTQDLTAIQGGTYVVTVTDATSCSTVETYQIIDTGVDIDSVSTSNEFCTDAGGEAIVFASGGTAPLNYQWTSTNTCCAYTLNLFDLNNNGWGGNPIPEVVVYINGVVYGNYTIPPGPGNSQESFVIPVCNGDQIQLEYVLGQANNNNTYELLDPTGAVVFADGPDPAGGIAFTGISNCGFSVSGTNTLSNLSAGTYSVLVTDALGCADSATVTVSNDPGTLAVSSVITDENCGQDDGAIDLTTTGGNGTITFDWNTGATSEDLTNLSAGTYNVTVSDTAGCQVTGTYDVLNNTGTLNLTEIITDDVCTDSIGAIDLTVSGGTAPYTFVWSNGVNTEDLTNLSAGNYSVDVTDATGCIISASYTVTNSSGGIVISGITTNETCGATNGAINISVTGGSAPYTYSWNTGASTEDITGVGSGSYTVTVNDATGCTWAESFQVNDTGVDIDNVFVADENCGDGSGIVQVIASGGTAPYTYTWSSSGPCCSYTINMFDTFGDGWNGGELEVFVNGSSAGVFAAAGNGSQASFSACTGNLIELVYSPGQFEDENSYNLLDPSGNIIFTDGPTPNTGSVFSATANCAFTTSGTNTLSGLSAGTYTVVVADALGCLDSTTAVVGNGSGTLVVNGVITNDNCGQMSGSIDLTISTPAAPALISWNTGDVTQSIYNLAAGTYTVTVSDANGCAFTGSYNVQNNTGSLAVLGTITNDVCTDSTGAVDITVIGGTSPYSYSWSNGSSLEDLTGVSAGTFDVDITDATGCTVSESFAVNNTSGGIAIAASISNETCGATNGAIDITVTGGTAPYTYNWNTGASTEDLAGIGSGTYTVTVDDATGCSWTDSFLLSDTGVDIDSLVIADEGCSNGDGAITTYGSGGTAPYTYTLLANNSCCTYTLQMFDTFGDGWNGGQLDVFVNGNNVGTFAAAGAGSQSSFGVCNGDAIELVYSAGQWEDENTYNLLDASGNVIFSDGPTPATGSVFTGTGACNYSISGSASNVFSGLTSGTYTVVMEDALGCLDSAVAVVNNGPGSLAVAASTTPENCGDGTGEIDMTVVGGTAPYAYAWNNGASSEDISGLNAGTYVVDIIDNNGCTLTQSFAVSNNTGGLAITGSSITDTYCGSQDGAVNITVSGGSAPYSFLWSNGATTEDIALIASGTYDVTVTDAAGCSLTSAYTVINNTNGLAVSAVVTDELCGNANGSIDVTATGGTAPYDFAWSNGPTTEDQTALVAGSYTLTVTDFTGCADVQTITIANNQGTLAIVSPVVTDEFCGFDNGAIDITIAGGTVPYTYNWSGGQSTQDLNGISQGSYAVIVTDANGCADSASYTLINTGTSVVSDTLITSATCVTCADGGIDITMDWGGGPPPTYTYSWSSGETTEDINGVITGTYTVTITEDNGCVLEETYVVPYDTSLDVFSHELITMDVYPNPSNGVFNVDYELNGDGHALMMVYDVIGKEVRRIALPSTSRGRAVVDLSTFSDGIYTIELSTGTSRLTKRISLAR